VAERNSIEQAKASLRHELAVLEERTVKVRQALRSLEELGAPSSNGGGKALPAGAPSKRLHGVTMIKGAALVLKDAHQPLHVSEIMERMVSGGYKPENPKSFRLSLVGSLDRGSRPGLPGWFYKPAPATYGLRELQAASAEATPKGHE
jgi:hypothetical protein